MGVKSIDSFISIFGRHYLYHLLSTWYKKYRHLLLCLLVILPFIAFSQNIPCGTDDYYLLRSSESSSLKEFKLNSRSATILPIVVHIVWFDEKDNLSDEVIAKQIERLNIDFNHTTKAGRIFLQNSQLRLATHRSDSASLPGTLQAIHIVALHEPEPL